MKLLHKLYFSFIVLAFILVGCSKDFLNPLDDNHNSLSRVYRDNTFAEGLLLGAYSIVPITTIGSTDVATDNAVTNDLINNAFLRLATGQWSAINNSLNNWASCNEAILYINQFLSVVDSVKWQSENPNVNAMFKTRLRGEAYALRGVLRYYLLQNNAGKSADGSLLGIQLFNNFLVSTSNFNMPRAAFSACVDSINSDFQKAINLLPMDYVDKVAADSLTTPFPIIGGKRVAVGDYNQVFGKIFTQRLTKRITLGYQSKVALLAASPAFNPDGNQALWVDAANTAANVLAGIGGLPGLNSNGKIFYQAARIDAITATADDREILWRGPNSTLTNNLEKDNLPPGLNGNGRINPSQNLVDAFPMASGYPIADPLSLYNAANPYANRDPRLALYIVCNGQTLQSKVIKTGFGGGVNAKDSLTTSTRTGYYLRKLIREDIIISNDGSATTKKHYGVMIRYTELFLNYAEAANEAWGPKGVGTVATYSAYDVIRAIRGRAGILALDPYLNVAATDQNAMRNLIRNERRLELCFEGFRFWDMRRWGLDLTESVTGIQINGASFTFPEIEKRVYKPFMQYGPIPYQEVLKFSALVQNAGW